MLYCNMTDLCVAIAVPAKFVLLTLVRRDHGLNERSIIVEEPGRITG